MYTKKLEDQMYNSILVPIDISEDDLTHMVIPYVQAHAVLNTSKVHFLTVIPSLPYYSALGLAYAAEMTKLEEFQRTALSKLDEIVKQFHIPADKIQTYAVPGSPKDQILKLAEMINSDLIIIASHKPGISTYLLGSNAGAVVRHAKCPVLVIR
jgi:universal stress protein F